MSTLAAPEEIDLHQLHDVLVAYRNGDFSARMPTDHVGLPGKVADTLNEIMAFAATFSSDINRVATVVGKEGRLSDRLTMYDARGSWADCVKSINDLVTDLGQPISETARVIGAVAKGDLGQSMALEIEGRPLKGECLRTATIVNGMVDQLGTFSSEVTRVAREVGTEGKLGGQAVVKGVSGTWKDLTDSVNSMASNLTGQVRNITEVAIAVASGDLSKKITVDVRGEILQLKDAINTMVDQLRVFAAEVTRVAREVGTDGKLGGQAVVLGVAGTWKDLTDNVNFMAGNLTAQVRDIADVATAVARGDLSKKITVDVKGEILELKNTINTMVDQLGSFASEVTRVAREVGTDGKLGGQAVVPGVTGTWKDLTDNVNFMAGNLTAQVRDIADVATAVARGDLSKKITVDVKGEILELKNTINTMVDQLSAFASEVTRVAREVGTEGKLGGQADVPGVGGTWKDLTDNVNFMAGNLTGQVRNIAEVTTAVARGDLSKKITVDVKGEILELKNTINTMVDQLSAFASEVTRVAREVGTEGKLGGQADVPGVGGTWKDLTDNVNFMASNLTGQVRNIAEVTTAVARGDLSKKITVDVKGEILELKNTINTMVDQLSAFASEVTRVAREVGTEGKLGGQADVPGVGGTWKDLTDNVNYMASNLTGQVRNIAEVTTAVANGDLSKKITVDVKGEILELKNTINTMVDQLSSFASEVTRVAREVGTDGKLGGQATVRGVAGTWKDLTDNVNFMASNLTGQVRNIAEVTTAVARGDLSKKITVDVKGEILELKNTINTMVDQLSSFASEVTRVAREVGTEGKLGGQADVPGVGGTWKDLTDNVNFMAGSLTSQVRNVAEVTTAVASGDLSKKITVDAKGEILELKNTINTMVDQLNSFASEVTRVAREVGTEGKLGGQADVPGVGGTWKDLTDNVNFMASNLTGQVRNIADVTTAVANGDLSKKVTVDVKGEILELKNTINTMVDQLNSFASEVTRVAREVGTEGKLGGQATVRGVGGTWKDLTDNVNYMAANLTTQVRSIAKVVKAVAQGDLKRKLVLEAMGEIAELAETINAMIDTLAVFAEQVTTVAREVGIEGKLGGQARVPGAAGTWRDLTDNVNQLAGNLTTQVRAISDVATAVAKGDLTRWITVDASGEVQALKDNINQMISNLATTTRVNADQDWLKTNLAKFTRMLQGQRDLATVSTQMLNEVAPLVGAQHAVLYVSYGEEADQSLRCLATYGVDQLAKFREAIPVGQGLIGQTAQTKERILVPELPADYIRISSGLGEASPRSLVVLPVLFEGQVKAVIELATFSTFTEVHLDFLDQLTESVGIVFNTIEATMRTEELLAQSTALADELRTRQDELTQTNHQLALTSKYKSEFLANMSHELRTPLNSLLILAQMLKDNPDGNLNHKQVDYAATIHSAGSDLLDLINDILDLAKIESGTVGVDIATVRLADVRGFVERTFRQVAESKNLAFEIDFSVRAHDAMRTDGKRLQQVLKNLLSNAFKFTVRGTVRLSCFIASGGWSREHAVLNGADVVLAFAVTDTGIGIPLDKQQIIFEAFQQAEGGTSRMFGGTGLGLSISREISHMLGGDIRLQSEPGKGSTFTLYVPLNYVTPVRQRVVSQGNAQQEQAPTASTPALMPPRQQLTAPMPEELPVTEAELVVPFDVEDDRDAIEPGDRVLLVVEDDPTFARILVDMARKQGFKVAATPHADSALLLARHLTPAAITLDLHLPDRDGWSVLDRLKHHPATRHIPIQVVTASDERRRGLREGAFAVVHKPVSIETLDESLERLAAFCNRKTKTVMVVEDDPIQQQSIRELIGSDEIKMIMASTGREALQALESEPVDCVVLDLRLPDTSGVELMEQIRQIPAMQDLPIIVYTGRDITPDEETEMRRLAEAIILKDASSPERLLAETSLFLHRKEGDLAPHKRQLMERVRLSDPALEGRKVLIVDDDVRNIFALTAALERHRMKVIYAENGKDAIARLTATPDTDIVLMDVMMPEMDGYETMRAVRALPEFAKLPIVALTAKAMKGDREKCLEAGASDYVSKPVDPEVLLSVLRVWLYA